jgi:NAD(P)-dependent dehydrogenase (short-subunit alcohol dehydrogenase family)
MTNGTSLAGQRVAVVGGSSGIGLAVAQAAAAHGADVFVCSRDPSRAGDAVDGATAIAIDVTDDASVNDFFEQVGSLNHLVCTAASGFPAGLFRAPAEDVRGLMESKFWGQYRCARSAAPILAEGGSITFTSGIRSRRPARGTEAFTVVNMAVEGMARALALELAPLRVNAVAPGTVQTPVFDFMPADVREKRLQAAAGQTTVGRVGQPPELADVFLMCMTNGFLTGTVIDADGGAMLA